MACPCGLSEGPCRLPHLSASLSTQEGVEPAGTDAGPSGRRRFNWEQHDESPLTLEEVGQIIGVTKERVRQIQNKALAKIRGVLEDGVLRTKTRLPGEPLKAERESAD